MSDTSLLPRSKFGEDWRHGGFGVYIHWPFCEAKCPYCDFNSHVWREIDQRRWARALASELMAVHAHVPERTVDTVFFGGGTPSLMEPDTVAHLIETVDRLWGFTDAPEITLEANPTSVEAERFHGYADAGVNRLSMGVQALNDSDLRALGRRHSVTEARDAFDIARAVFDRVSFDLIYARMRQTEEAWAAELREALAMAVDHLSLYQLTIEPGTRFQDLYDRGRLQTPTDNTAAGMYERTQEICAVAGRPAYEVSNHAVPGAESRHNLVYWRYGDYAGVGPGAHGRLTTSKGRFPTDTLLPPGEWLATVETAGSALRFGEPLSPTEQGEEMMMMGLRLAEGVDLRRFEALAGRAVDTRALADLAVLGFVSKQRGRLKVTEAGRPVLNAVLREVLAN